ncbi:MAG: hypothetical protein MR343_06090 [Clostridia bacterium]|nr:hypothetical protein [Clostridia bacterium]MDD7700184.1 hypothetical protein [Eubacteriales bacterium]MDY2827466.1 hypothetical protein [Eubacteriales bacterium]
MRPRLSVFDIPTSGTYEHFSFTAEKADSVRNAILALCFGILLAALYMFYQQSVPGALVRALLRVEALSPETAKTLDELELRQRRLLGFELRHNAALRHTVKEIKDGEVTRYYIPEEGKYRAAVRFEKKGNGLRDLILTTLLTVGLSILLIRLFPLLLLFIDAIL